MEIHNVQMARVPLLEGEPCFRQLFSPLSFAGSNSWSQTAIRSTLSQPSILMSYSIQGALENGQEPLISTAEMGYRVQIWCGNFSPSDTSNCYSEQRRERVAGRGWTEFESHIPFLRNWKSGVGIRVDCREKQVNQQSIKLQSDKAIVKILRVCRGNSFWKMSLRSMDITPRLSCKRVNQEMCHKRLVGFLSP